MMVLQFAALLVDDLIDDVIYAGCAGKETDKAFLGEFAQSFFGGLLRGSQGFDVLLVADFHLVKIFVQFGFFIAWGNVFQINRQGELAKLEILRRGQLKII